MRRSKTLAKLRRGEPVFCYKSALAHPDVVELMGLMGVDVVWICNEHVSVGEQVGREIMRAARAADTDILLRRVASHYDRLIQPLEMGCAGLMIPHCHDAAMAREVVAMCKYAPLGRRALDGIGADADFGTAALRDYMAHANRETFLMMQIEDVQSLDQVEAIAATPGVDLLFVGPLDLSQSLGCPGDVKHPAIQAAIDRTVRACERQGIWCGTAGLDEAHTRSLLDRGVRFITVKSDYAMVKQGLTKSLREMAQVLAEVTQTSGSPATA